MRLIAIIMLAGAITGCSSLGDQTVSANQLIRTRSACAEVSPTPSTDERLRPRQNIVCSYSAAELNRRLLRLLQVEPRALSVASVETALGLPRLYTSFDDEDARSATYGTTVKAAPDQGEWAIQISFSEIFYPPVAGRPARFRGTTRPALIDKRNRGEIRLGVTWLPPFVSDLQPRDCLAVDEFVKSARRSGWRNRGLQTSFTSHGDAIQRIEVSKGKARADVDVSRSRVCAYDLNLNREMDRDEPPVTEEELRSN